MSDDLLYRVENGVAWITLNRPESGNALTPAMRDGMREIVESFNGNHEVRAAVITAAGEKMFCPGADIRMDRSDNERPAHLPDVIVGEPRRMMLSGQLKLMPAILDCVRAEVTLGEISNALREIYGEHRDAPAG